LHDPRCRALSSTGRPRPAGPSGALLWYSLLVALVLAGRAGTAAALRVPCDQVIARASHQVRAEHGVSPDLSKLAKQLGTTSGWVEHCMSTYGRRQRRPEIQPGDQREERLELLEIEEPEEVAPEDTEEPGEHEREEGPEERQRNLHLQPTPKRDPFLGE